MRPVRPRSSPCSAVALGRTRSGVLLDLGCGPGMAATRTAVGLVLVRLRERVAVVERARDQPHRATAPEVIVGTGLALRTGSGW